MTETQKRLARINADMLVAQQKAARTNAYITGGIFAVGAMAFIASFILRAM